MKNQSKLILGVMLLATVGLVGCGPEEEAVNSLDGVQNKQDQTLTILNHTFNYNVENTENVYHETTQNDAGEDVNVYWTAAEHEGETALIRFELDEEGNPVNVVRYDQVDADSLAKWEGDDATEQSRQEFVDALKNHPVFININVQVVAETDDE